MTFPSGPTTTPPSARVGSSSTSSPRCMETRTSRSSLTLETWWRTPSPSTSLLITSQWLWFTSWTQVSLRKTFWNWENTIDFEIITNRSNFKITFDPKFNKNEPISYLLTYYQVQYFLFSKNQIEKFEKFILSFLPSSQFLKLVMIENNY